MDSMLSAIKARRGAQKGPMPEEAPMNQPQEQAGADMQGLVASLSPEQKQMLMQVLVQSVQGSQAGDVEQGAPSMDEKKAIDQKIQEQGEEMPEEYAESGSGISQDESDEIGKSMLDHKAKTMVEAGAKPRNLGDRVRMTIASKLKGKGKLK